MAIIKNSNLNLFQVSKNRVSGKSNDNSKSDYRQNLNFGAAINPEKIKLRDSYLKEFKNSIIVKNFDSTVGCLTAAASVAGFGVGGTGLLYDCMVKKAKAKDKNKPKEQGVPMPPAIPLRESDDPSAPSTTTASLQKVNGEAKQENNIVSFKGNESNSTEKTEKKKDSHEGEYGYIVPETEFGKLGLVFTKIALAVSGTAGILSGIALRVPLISAGEFVGNILSAPIITTPAGFGLMSIGMATLLSGRALENNPSLKLNTAILSNQKSIGGKIKYVMQNMGDGLKETWHTIKHVGHQTANLASSNKQVKDEAAHFFKHYMFKIRSSTITAKQKVLANGKTIVESGLKTHPYQLHTAAGILAASGALLVVEDLLERAGVIKGDKIRKACFNAAKAGQFADNIGLTTYGLSRCAKGAPVLGVPVVIAGSTMLYGAPKVDRDEGKGIIWTALSFFFMLFTIERGIETGLAIRNRKALKMKPIMDEFSDFAKLFEIDFSKVGKLTKKQLDNLLKVSGGREEAMLHIKQLFSPNNLGKKAEQKIAEETAQAIKELENDSNPILKEVPRLLKVLKEDILSGVYKPDFSEADLVKALKEKGFSKEFINYITQNDIVKISGKQKHLQEALSSIHKENCRRFGVNYIPKLDAIIKDSNSPAWAVEAAKKAKVDFADLLQKN